MHNRILSIAALVLFVAAAAIARETKNGFDLSDALVPPDEIVSGGVPRDGIPSIDKPRFVSSDKAKFLRGRDRVLGVRHNGIAKAYPIRILNYHEVVNDRFGDEALVITYCPLCYSGMAFAAQGKDIHLTFGVSGLLYNSDVLLYDRQTGSLWSQLMSKAVSGPLKGFTIPPVPASHTTWREWRERHADTLVLSTDTGFRRDYRISPYGDYEQSGQLMFPVAKRNREFRRKELVLGIDLDGTHKAYPFKELRKHGRESFTDVVAGRHLTIEWSKDDKFARALDETGREVTTVIVYWFAWYAFHPGTEVFRAGPSDD